MSAVARVLHPTVHRRILPLTLGSKSVILASAGTRAKGKMVFAPRRGFNLVIPPKKWRPVKVVNQSTE